MKKHIFLELWIFHEIIHRILTCIWMLTKTIYMYNMLMKFQVHVTYFYTLMVTKQFFNISSEISFKLQLTVYGIIATNQVSTAQMISNILIIFVQNNYNIYK